MAPWGCLGLFLPGVICLCPSSSTVPSSLLPPPTSDFLLHLDATPHPTGPWTPMSSGVACVMGVLGPSTRLLFLPLLLTVGGELGAITATSRIPGLSLGQSREQGRERTKKGDGEKQSPSPPKLMAVSQSLRPQDVASGSSGGGGGNSTWCCNRTSRGRSNTVSDLDAGPQVPPDTAFHSYLLALGTHPPQLLHPPSSHNPLPQFTFFFSPQVSALFRHRTVGLDSVVPLPTSQRAPHLCLFPKLSKPSPVDTSSQFPAPSDNPQPLSHILRMQLLCDESWGAGGDCAGGPGADPPHCLGCVLLGPALPSGARGCGG